MSRGLGHVTPRAVPRVLSIAGTDPTGGAGVQADLKSIGAAGGYGMAVVTALVAQNTHGVRSVHTPPAEFLREQLDAVSDDVVVDAVKIGMLGGVAAIREVASWLERVAPPIVVLDPVMVATSGDRLLDAAAEHELRDLVRRADVVTPNVPELAVLADEPAAHDREALVAQAHRVSAALDVVVLAKGGHLGGPDSPDALVDASGGLRGGATRVDLPARRVETRNTHGTGCSLSSALATHAARSGDWVDALTRSKEWLLLALEAADDLEVGGGAGPIDHLVALRPRGEAPSSSATATWWADVADLRLRLDELEFVRRMSDGSLDRGVFEHYLAQDAVYLERYARALSRASALAPTPDEQAFWATSAAACLGVERELHRERLGGELDTMPLVHEATTAYTDHLLAIAGGASYGELVAAVLPCFWLYSDLGERLLAARTAEHPYGEWLDTYADPGFADSTARAREIADRAAERAPEHERAAMARAFRVSCAHEVAFFDMRPPAAAADVELA